MYCSCCNTKMEHWGTLKGITLWVCPKCGYRKKVKA